MPRAVKTVSGMPTLCPTSTADAAGSGMIFARTRAAMSEPVRAVSEPWKERRNLSYVLLIEDAELGERLALLDARQSHIHEDQDRKHRERQQGRPLQQEPEHHQDEAHVLRVPH